MQQKHGGVAVIYYRGKKVEKDQEGLQKGKTVYDSLFRGVSLLIYWRLNLPWGARNFMISSDLMRVDVTFALQIVSPRISLEYGGYIQIYFLLIINGNNWTPTNLKDEI